MRCRTLLICIAVTLPLGCGTSWQASQGGFDSDDPASKLYAITRAGENRDQTAVRHLIDQLDSDDAAVRMMAIMALEHVIGTRMGYNPYDTIENRQQAVEAWTQAYGQEWPKEQKKRYD